MAVTVTNTATKLLIAVEREVLQQPAGLLKAWGLRTLREVDEIFRAQGKPPWAPLRPSTISAKRQGRGTGGPQALAGLRRSWDARQTGPRSVTVFNTNPIAGFHEDGTKGPYEIRPKHAKALALPFLPGRDAGKGTAGTGKAGRFSLSGLGRSRATGRGSFKGPSGGTKVPYSNVSFRRKVIHPGLPKRPMLPTPAQLIPILQREAAAFIAFVARKRGNG